MRCIICKKDMECTGGGNYECKTCGILLNDLVYRGPSFPSRSDQTIPNIEFESPKPTAPRSDQTTHVLDGSLPNGWICPKCGKGISPYVMVCPCCDVHVSPLSNLNMN